MMNKLSIRIAGFVGAIVLIVSLAIGMISISCSSNTLVNNQEESMHLLAIEGANHVVGEINTSLQILNEIGATKAMSGMDWKLQRQYLLTSIERLGYLDIAVAALDGTAQYVAVDTTFQVGEEEYFKQALAGGVSMSDLSIDAETNSPVIMYAAPITEFGKVVGVLIAKKDGTVLNDITDQMGIGERGYAFILGGDTTFYAYPDREQVLKQTNAYTDIEKKGTFREFGQELQRIKAGNEGVIKYSYVGEKQIAAIVPIPGTDWIFGIGNAESDILKSLKTLTAFLIITMVIVLILGIAAGGYVGTLISKPIKMILSTVERMSRYDLTDSNDKQDEVILKRQDEIGLIAKMVKTMRENISTLIQTVAEGSEQVAASSEELTSITSQSATASDEVGTIIQQIAASSSEQAEKTELGSRSVRNLSDLLMKVQHNISELNTSVNEVNQLKKLGIDAIKDLHEKNKETSSAAKEIYNGILETSVSAEKIIAASNMIKGIADQTNLLSLNAAIEAARAGEAGHGFAVVAGEIRKLAEQSNRFANDIAAVINDLSGKTKSTVEIMESVRTILNSQTTSVNNTSNNFEGIHKVVEKMKIEIDSLNNSNRDMENSKDNMVETIENLYTISEKNATGTHEAAASVEEQIASMEEIANASDSLALLAEELQSEIQKFKY